MMKRISDPNIQEFEVRHLETVKQAASECVVLLKHDGSLPWKNIPTVALYGNGARHTIKGGTGSGDLVVRNMLNVEEAFEQAGIHVTSKAWLDAYDQTYLFARQQFLNGIREQAKAQNTNPVMLGMGKVMDEPNYDIPLEAMGDTAVYVLSRISGEGSDRQATEGDILLTPTEIRDILKLNRTYENFILVLNVGGLVDLTPVLEVKNILLLSQLGGITSEVLVDILKGESYPSGKLAMTWAPIENYPSTNGFGDPDDTRYNEGIYVGYRYFNTVQKVPTFPFGYGLSFTHFEQECQAVVVSGETVQVKIKVVNTGNFKGKEVVQLYSQAPQGSLDKPSQELIGFAKTEEIAPGQSDTVLIECDLNQLASYSSDLSAYLVEKGNYQLLQGNSSATTKAIAKLTLRDTVVLSQHTKICPGWDFNDFVPETRAEDFGDSSKYHLELSPENFGQSSMTYSPASQELKKQEAFSWDKVVAGERSVDDFVATLTDEELAYMVVGMYPEEESFMVNVGASSQSVAGAAGETSAKLSDKDVPTVVMADGPAGVRISETYKIVNGRIKPTSNPLAAMMEFFSPEELEQMASMAPQPTQEELDAATYYQYATALPIGTAIAQSLNLSLAENCGRVVGEEMTLHGIHLWLAPALNIQRSPLCGRNFEYYSEDPLLSGLVAAAVTNGVQSQPGCGVTIKHFAANNQETNRFVSNSIVSERALREIYLKTFEICVKASNPSAIMSSYNLINGEHACTSEDLLTIILRDEWSYKGIVMTDWYATQNIMAKESGRTNKHDVASALGCVQAGNDLIMPGTEADKLTILEALQSSAPPYGMTRGHLQRNVANILNCILKLAGK
ncbi:beta-glucosidase [Streptococcus moroccensis]|uniref:Beta-glucosidase n=1 Tax=Streptococcus moroccensis TaxID=1451356 RepID=A0ABT9YPC3_9STRE|nr:glycoside hydrolase family 3 N-terminal domain-containing protein [Streptococcus moroccensis]MDQ0221831.1 beta-glucosidase [Streptococcus moroccensis]